MTHVKMNSSTANNVGHSVTKDHNTKKIGTGFKNMNPNTTTVTVPFRAMGGINASGVMYTTEDFLNQINDLGMIYCYECGREFNTSHSRPVQSACGHVKCSTCFYYTVTQGDHYCQICALATSNISTRRIQKYRKIKNHLTHYSSTCLPNPNPTTDQIIMATSRSDTAMKIRTNQGVAKISQPLSMRDSDSNPYPNYPNSYPNPNPRQHQYPAGTGLLESQNQHKQHASVRGKMPKIRQRRRGSPVPPKTSHNQPITSFSPTPTPTPIKSVTTLHQRDNLTKWFAYQKEFQTWNSLKTHCRTLRHNVNDLTNIDLQNHLQPKSFENHEKQRLSVPPSVTCTATATTEYNDNGSIINFKEKHISSKTNTPIRGKNTLKNLEIKNPVLHQSQRRKNVTAGNQSTNLLTPMLKPKSKTFTTLVSSPLDNMDATRSSNIISNNDSTHSLRVYDFNLNDTDSEWGTGTTYRPLSKKVNLAFSKLQSYVEAPLPLHIKSQVEVEAATTVNPNIIITLPPTPPTIKSRTKTGTTPSAPQLPLPPRTPTTHMKEFETSLPGTKRNRLNHVTFDIVPPEQELHTETETESEYNSINNEVILKLKENPTAVPFKIGASAFPSDSESKLAQEPSAQGSSNLFQGECPWSVVTIVYEENGVW